MTGNMQMYDMNYTRTNNPVKLIGVGWIPAALGVCIATAALISFVWAVLAGDVTVFVPFISEAGADPPQSGLFSLMILVSCIWSGVTMVIRYSIVRQLLRFNQGELLNSCALAIGFLCILGLAIVAAYPSILSAWMYPWHNGRYIVVIRGTITTVAAVAAITTAVCQVTAKRLWTESGIEKPDDMRLPGDPVVVHVQDGKTEGTIECGDVLATELNAGEHSIIRGSTQEVKQRTELPANANRTTESQTNVDLCANTSKIKENNSYHDDSVGHSSSQIVGKVDASQCEDNILLNSAIPGLYRSSSPEIIVATEPQDLELSWEAIPATQQNETFEKSIALTRDDIYDNDEVIDSTDDETIGTNVPTSAMNGKPSPTVEPVSVAETPLEHGKATVIQRSTTLEEKTARLSQESERRLTTSESSAHENAENSDSDDSFVGKCSTDSRHNMSIGSKKKFIKKRAVYFSSDDSKDDDNDEDEQNGKNSCPMERALPDLESQFVMESTEQHRFPISKSTSALDGRLEPVPEEQPSPVVAKENLGMVAECPEVAENVAPLGKTEIKNKKSLEVGDVVEATERDPEAVTAGIVHDIVNVTAAQQLQSIADVKDVNHGENIRDKLFSCKEQPIEQLVDDTQCNISDNQPKLSVNAEKEIEIPDTEEQNVSNLIQNRDELEGKSLGKNHIEITEISLTEQDKEPSNIVPNRPSALSVDTQESLKLALLSESMNKEVDASIGNDLARNVCESTLLDKIESDKAKELIPEQEQACDNSNGRSYEVCSSPSNELDISAAAMLERLAKLKKRKSAWQQAKEELQAEGLFPSEQANLQKNRQKTTGELVASVTKWLAENNPGVVEEYRDALIATNDIDGGGAKMLPLMETDRAVKEALPCNPGQAKIRDWSRGSSPVVETVSQLEQADPVEGESRIPPVSRKRASNERSNSPVAKRKCGSPLKKASATNSSAAITSPKKSTTSSEVEKSSPVDKMTSNEAIGGKLDKLSSSPEAMQITTEKLVVQKEHSNDEPTVAPPNDIGLVPETGLLEVSNTVSTVSSVEETPADKNSASLADNVSEKASKSVSTETAENLTEFPSAATKDASTKSASCNVSNMQTRSTRQRSLYHSQELDSQNPFESIQDQSQRRYTVADVAREAARSRCRQIHTSPIDPSQEKEVLVPESVEHTVKNEEQCSSENLQNLIESKGEIVIFEDSAVVEETSQDSTADNNPRTRRSTRARSDARLKRVVKSLASSKLDPTLSQSDPFARDTIDLDALSASCPKSSPVTKPRNARGRKGNTRTRTTIEDNAIVDDSVTSLKMVPFSEEISPPLGADTQESTGTGRKRTAATRQKPSKQSKTPLQKGISTTSPTDKAHKNILPEAPPASSKRCGPPTGTPKRAHSPEEPGEVRSKKKRVSANLPGSELETSVVESNTSSSSSLSVTRLAKLRVMFTGIDNPPKDKLAELSIKTTDVPSQCALVVATKFTRTVKMMYAVACGIPVVSLDWVTESHKAKKLLDISQFMLRDEAAEAKFSFSLAATLRVAAEEKIFDGWTFFVTKGCIPNSEQIKEMLGGCNVKVVPKKPSQSAERTAIVSCANDLASLGKNNPVPVVSIEFVLNGILHHRINLEKYSLFKK
ncbi:DNA damage-regulated autophagy modulator protein 1-like [Tropilaelaps mercedesae]|uniref:PAX-interacting protein 1 n=1 Tax=Tropilaelaps mercedesae TaxID=418985 RepID=A0A1V9XQZ0_9ACAR|nr:DNA damage-regulated autophagy modulator protein 1-like [Tropilaelaps mercedesae]